MDDDDDNNNNNRNVSNIWEAWWQIMQDVHINFNPGLLRQTGIPHEAVSSNQPTGLKFKEGTSNARGPGSSVDIATDYGVDGPGIENRWGEIFRRPYRPWGPSSLLCNGYRVFPEDKERPGGDADPLTSF